MKHAILNNHQRHQQLTPCLRVHSDQGRQKSENGAMMGAGPPARSVHQRHLVAGVSHVEHSHPQRHLVAGVSHVEHSHPQRQLVAGVSHGEHSHPRSEPPKWF